MKCIWETTTECSGEIQRAEIAASVIVPICEKHMVRHNRIMQAYTNGEDVEALLASDELLKL